MSLLSNPFLHITITTHKTKFSIGNVYNTLYNTHTTLSIDSCFHTATNCKGEETI